MLSIRRKCKYVVHEHEVENLKAKFEARDATDIRDDGKHVLLKFLVRTAAAQLDGVPIGNIVDEIDFINAHGVLPTAEQLHKLRARCSAWLASAEVPGP